MVIQAKRSKCKINTFSKHQCWFTFKSVDDQESDNANPCLKGIPGEIDYEISFETYVLKTN